MKLLIVRLSALGDVVHTLPALELLRAALPAAHLTWAVEALAAPLLVGHPALDEVVVLDRRAAIRGPKRLDGARRYGEGIRALRRGGFDAALDMQGLLRSALVARASGAKRVFGAAWAREGAALLYRTRLEVPAPGEAHAVERAAAFVRHMLRALGEPEPSAELGAPRLPSGFATPRAATAPLLVLLPGAGKPANRPAPELLAAVADRCQKRRSTLSVVLLGGPADGPLAEQVLAQCAVARPTLACGGSLSESAGWLASASVVVGGDTGPLHLARALGAPVVGLFHAAEPARTSPAGVPGASGVAVFPGTASCSPCRARRCERADGVRVCLDSYGSEGVAQAALDLMG